MRPFVSRWSLLASFAVLCAPALEAQDTSTFRPPPPLPPALRLANAPADSQQARPRAITQSDFYYTRLAIHRIGSYTMLPLFAGEYVLGNKLLADDQNGVRPSRTIRSEHATVAAGLGVLFGVNTVTGLWNLWDSRHDPSGSTRKYLHAALMLASDAGMVWAGVSAGEARHRAGGAQRHRNIALGAFTLGTAGTAMMWLWK